MMKFSDFGFRENPFAITPDPRYLFLSRGHEESLAHLIYGTGPNGGFVLLTGEVGTGKTLLIRSLLAQQLSEIDIALVLNPRLSRREFIATICDELGVEYKGPPYSLKQLIDALTRHLLKTHSEGRHTVLVVDEAQNLSSRVLETVRLLTNLETTRYKLLRIILVGQPELLQMLESKELRQVDQRITARYHLSPLEGQETASYISHRLVVAGIREDLFTPAALRLIHRLSGGIPRMINTLCERSLLAIFSSGQQRAGVSLVWQAWREVRGRKHRSSLKLWSAMAAVVLVVVGLLVYLLWPGRLPAPDPQAAQAQSEPAPASRAEAATPTSQTAMADLAPAKESTLFEPVDAQASPVSPEAATPVAVDSEVEPVPPGQSATADKLDLRRLFQQPQSRDRLYLALFALWDETFSTDSPLTPCMQAPMHGLRCLRDQGNWRQIEALNRPLLLRLVKDKQSRLLLLKLKDGEILVVNDGDGETLLETSELEPYWRGEFVMLWKPHEGVALIGDGSSGKAVTWLRHRLQGFDHQPATPVEGIDRFDEALKRRLRSFQRRQGLDEDGMAGQQTLIHLNNLTSQPGRPTLVAESGTRED